MYHAEEKKEESGDSSAVLSHSDRAIAAAITVAKNQTTERDSHLLVAAIAAAVRAIQTKETEQDGYHIVTAVRYAVPTMEAARIDLAPLPPTSGHDATEIERTKAAITAVIKVAKNQETEEDSKLLVAAVVAAVKAVQNEETGRDADLIITAVQAAVPDSEELMERCKIQERVASEVKEKMAQEREQMTREIRDEIIREERKKKQEAREQEEKQKKESEDQDDVAGKKEKKSLLKKVKAKMTMENAAHASVIANNVTATAKNV